MEDSILERIDDLKYEMENILNQLKATRVREAELRKMLINLAKAILEDNPSLKSLAEYVIHTEGDS